LAHPKKLEAKQAKSEKGQKEPYAGSEKQN